MKKLVRSAEIKRGEVKVLATTFKGDVNTISKYSPKNWVTSRIINISSALQFEGKSKVYTT